MDAKVNSNSDTHSESVQEKVKDYYGEVLQSSSDLKTSACCPIDAMPEFLKPYLSNIHDEVITRFYGCGSPIPLSLEGKTVLDLGCGTGRDCYLLSQMVGPEGKVIGIDMTEEQLKVARETLPWHMEKFGYTQPNAEFHHAFIEDLTTAGLADNSIDVVVSNCVINLSANKENVFKEIFRVLKPGGELFFSDVYADRRLNAEQQQDKVLLGECLGGALYTEDFRRLMNKVGVADYRICSKGQIELLDPQVLDMAGDTKFYSLTVRAFKLDLEDRCEDYGQVATYLGGIPHGKHHFELDDHHRFIKNKPMLVCRNTAEMLSQSRYQAYFNVTEPVEHFGLFDCADDISLNNSDDIAGCC